MHITQLWKSPPDTWFCLDPGVSESNWEGEVADVQIDWFHLNKGSRLHTLTKHEILSPSFLFIYSVNGLYLPGHFQGAWSLELEQPSRKPNPCPNFFSHWLTPLKWHRELVEITKNPPGFTPFLALLPWLGIIISEVWSRPFSSFLKLLQNPS